MQSSHISRQFWKWGVVLLDRNRFNSIDLIVNRPLMAHLSLYTRLTPTCDKKIEIMGLVYIINQ